MGHLLPTVTSAFLIATTLQANALDRHVKIVNQTSSTIVELYGSHIDTRSWQEDILAGRTIPPGSARNVNYDDGTGYCRFDFLAVFDDGDRVVRQNLNVCEVGTFTYSN